MSVRLSLDEIFDESESVTRILHPCGNTIVVLEFAPIGRSNASEHVMSDKPPEILPTIAQEVKLEVRWKEGKRERIISEWFSAVECVEIFRGKWPNEDNLDRILGAIQERKLNGRVMLEIPGGGGKSFEAQGQTKKDGSHSHDKHR